MPRIPVERLRALLLRGLGIKGPEVPSNRGRPVGERGAEEAAPSGFRRRREEAEAYDAWIREEVRTSLEEQGADIPHEAVAWMRARIAERRKVTNDC